MGYRSEVAISMFRKDFDRMVKEKGEDIKDLLNYAEHICLHKCESNPDKDVVVVKWDWIKWYEEYTDIAAVINFLNEYDEETDEPLVPHIFVRLGEDPEDQEYEEQCDWENNDYDYLDKIRPIHYIETELDDEYTFDI